VLERIAIVPSTGIGWSELPRQPGWAPGAPAGGGCANGHPLLADAAGPPLDIAVSGANRHDSMLVGDSVAGSRW
jgi:hypothetical protein